MDRDPAVNRFSAYVGDVPLSGTGLPGRLDGAAKHTQASRPERLEDRLDSVVRYGP